MRSLPILTANRRHFGVALNFGRTQSRPAMRRTHPCRDGLKGNDAMV
jgi:hypothetical protein